MRPLTNTFVYELRGCGFESPCCHFDKYLKNFSDSWKSHVPFFGYLFSYIKVILSTWKIEYGKWCNVLFWIYLLSQELFGYETCVTMVMDYNILRKNTIFLGNIFNDLNGWVLNPSTCWFSNLPQLIKNQNDDFLFWDNKKVHIIYQNKTGRNILPLYQNQIRLLN